MCNKPKRTSNFNDSSDSSVELDFIKKLARSGRNSAEKATILVASLPFLEVNAFCCLCDFRQGVLVAFPRTRP